MSQSIILKRVKGYDLANVHDDGTCQAVVDVWEKDSVGRANFFAQITVRIKPTPEKTLGQLEDEAVGLADDLMRRASRQD